MDMMVVGIAAIIGFISGLILGFKVKKPLTDKPVIRVTSYSIICTAAGIAAGWFLAPFILSFV